MSDLIAKGMDMNPEVRFDHCFFHREVIIAKTLPSVLQESYIITDPIKSRPSVHGLFGVVPGIAACTQKCGGSHVFFKFERRSMHFVDIRITSVHKHLEKMNE